METDNCSSTVLSFEYIILYSGFSSCLAPLKVVEWGGG